MDKDVSYDWVDYNLSYNRVDFSVSYKIQVGGHLVLGESSSSWM